MTKEERMCSMKGIRNNPEELITLRGQSNKKNRLEIDSSQPYSRKSTTNLLIPDSKEVPLLNEDSSIKKSFSFSGTPCETESRKQPLRESGKNKPSSHREAKLDMKTVCKRMAEFERILLKRAQMAEEKKRQSLPATSNTSKDQSRPTNTVVDLTLLRSNLESQNSIGLNYPISNILSSGNPTLTKNKSMIPRRKIKTNVTRNRKPTAKTSTNSKQPKSTLRILRKAVPTKLSNLDQAAKITSEAALPANSKTWHRNPTKNTTGVEEPAKTSTDAALTRSKSRAGRKIMSKNIASADPASKTFAELAKSRVSQSRSRIDKSAVNQSSINRSSRPPERKSTNAQIDDPKKRNLSKVHPTKARSGSKSMDNSPRRRSQVGIPKEPTNDVSPAQAHADVSIEPVNTPQHDQNTDSTPIPNSETATATSTSRSTQSPLGQERTGAPDDENQTTLSPNDQIEKASAVINNHDDQHFTSVSERILNPDGDIQQSSPETRSQPIPLDPNSANAAKHDLESWLRNTAAQRNDTPRPLKISITRPYPVFPVIRPCDKDITSDPEDCKKKLEQKLERMHKLKQAYYADPNDNIPFINLAYTKEGIFVDEPIENAIVYDDEFLKNEIYENHSRSSSGTRGNSSESIVFSSPRFKPRDDKASASFTSDKVVDSKSSYSKWLDKILDESENNMMENVLDEFQRKFNKLALNIQQVSLSSEISSTSETDSGSKPRINIPKRSSRSDK